MSAPDPKISHLTRGYLIAMGSALMLSTTSILIRYLSLTYRLPALVMAAWRDLFVFLTLALVFLILCAGKFSVERKFLPFLVIYGFILALFNSVWTLSVALNGAAVATVLAYCSGAFTALLGWWILKERLDWGKGLTILLTLSGCALVSGALDPAAWRVNLLGILTGILSGLLYAVYSLMGRSASHRGLDSWTTLFYIFGFATVFLFLGNMIPGLHLPGGITRMSDFMWLGNSWTGWSILFLLAAGPTLLGFGLYNKALTILPSSVTNLIVTTEPVFTTIIAYVFLGERFTWVQAAGSVLVLAGVIFLRIYEGWLAGKSQRKPDLLLPE